MITANLIPVIQTLGGAIGVPTAQAAFQNTLLKTLRRTAPDVDPYSILNAGASDLKSLVPSSSLNGVLEAYVAGFRETLIVGIAFAGAAVIASAGFRFMSVKETRRIEGQEMDGEN